LRPIARPLDVQRLGAALLALALFASVAAPARGAGEASDVVVEVVDAGGGAPIGLARVILQGDSAAIAYTDPDGRARFESVATGTYRAAVTKRDYDRASSPLFDVVADRTTTIRVRLGRAGGPKKIGGVSVTSSPARASREVGQNDALRFLDGSLRGAIGDLPGVTGSGDALSIDGNDASQTGASVDGVPLPGVGGLGGSGVNADLFASAAVSSGASNGALAGDVGFHTLQPTRAAQQQATLTYGSGNASSALFVARGSVNNLGYVVEHAVRGTTSALDGFDRLDESGQSYLHDGDTTTSGDLAKLRWAPSLAQTLTLTASATNATDADTCTAFTALEPCGYGPNLFTHQRSSFATLAESATIGATSVFAAAFANGSRIDGDQLAATFAGAPDPSESSTSIHAHGATLSVQAPAGERNDLSLLATAYGLDFGASALTTLGPSTLTDSSSYHSATIVDKLRPSARLTLTAQGGVNGGSGNASALGVLGAHWEPTRDLAYDVVARAGDAGSALAFTTSGLPDPRSLTYDCSAGIASGEVPAQNASHQRSSSVRAQVERSGRHGRLVLTGWSQRLQNAPVLAAYDPATLGLPPGYLQSVAALAMSPDVCGASPIAQLALAGVVPADQIVRGATLGGTWQVGSALLAGYASVQSRFVSAASPLTDVLTPVGTQVPGTPLHRAGIVATTKLGRSVDLLANLGYTAADNANRLPAYTQLNAGLAFPLRYGTLALVGRNLTNRFPGPFVPLADLVALPRVGAAPLPLAAQPLQPRAVELTYTVRTGRLGAEGSGAGTTDAQANGDEGGPGGNGVMIAIRGGPLPDREPANALTIDPDNEQCTPVAARVAQPVLDAIGAIRDRAARAYAAGRYPETLPGTPATVAGIRLTYVAYDGGTHYAIAAQGPIQPAAALINCTRVAIAKPEDIVSRHLFAPPQLGAVGLGYAYSPLVGIYLVPPAQPPHGMLQVQASTDPVPAAPPADPFARRSDCPPSAKPLADALVAASEAARVAQRAGQPVPPSDVATIEAHGSGPTAWLEIALTDMMGGAAAMQCLHVAGVQRADLSAAGIGDARRFGAFGFADRFGFYQIVPARDR
jgi:hypothetical protein